MIDQQSGRRLSPTKTIAPPDGEPADQYAVELDFSPVVGDDTGPGEELVRLSPPEGVVAPAILMERAALELFEGEAVIDHLAELPEPIVLEGRVETENAEPVQATVTLVATELDSLKPGTLASYQQTVEADAEGRFEAELLPGTYRVLAVPLVDSGLAVFDESWEVASKPQHQAGRTVLLPEGAKLVGNVVSPAGEPVAGASVHAVSSPSNGNVGALERALGEAPFVPRAASVLTRETGHFEVAADPGSYDVSIRPPEEAGFAWLVRPNVPVPEGAALGEMRLPLPVVYEGTLLVREDVVLPEALVRAYILLGSDGYADSRDDPDNPAVSVVQVAEVRADSQGHFRLLMPKELEGPGSTEP
jgi:hypothetical protein